MRVNFHFDSRTKRIPKSFHNRCANKPVRLQANRQDPRWLFRKLSTDRDVYISNRKSTSRLSGHPQPLTRRGHWAVSLLTKFQLKLEETTFKFNNTNPIQIPLHWLAEIEIRLISKGRWSGVSMCTLFQQLYRRPTGLHTTSIKQFGRNAKMRCNCAMGALGRTAPPFKSTFQTGFRFDLTLYGSA